MNNQGGMISGVEGSGAVSNYAVILGAGGDFLRFVVSVYTYFV